MARSNESNDDMSSNGKHAAVEDQPDLVELCLDHLTDTHVQLWGRAWNVSDPRARQQAAEWLAEQISEVFA